MKLLKWLIYTISTLLIIVVAALAYLSIVIDPNDYKQEISKLAEQQGVAINIRGDLNWQFFPNIAIQIGATELSGISLAIPHIQFKSASMVLDWRALLRRQIAVRSIYIDEADIRLDNTQQAGGTLAIAIAGSADQNLAQIGGPPQTNTVNFSLAIDHIEISNSRISLPGDETSNDNTAPVLSSFTLSGKGINTTGQAFPLQVSFQYHDPALGEDLNLVMDTKLLVNLPIEQFSIKDAEIKLTAPGWPELTLHIDAEFDAARDTLNIPSLLISSGDTAISTTLNAKGLRSKLLFDAEISIANINLRQALSDWQIDVSTLPGSALTQFSFDTLISGSVHGFKLQNLNITVDKFSTQGNITLHLDAPKAVAVALTGGTLDLNAYILGDDLNTGEDKPDQKASTPADSDTIFAPLAATLIWLEGGTADLDLGLETLIFDNITLENIQLKTHIEQTTIEIIELSANTFGGNINSSGSLDLRSKIPRLSFIQSIKSIDVAQLATAFDAEPAVTGALNFDFQGTTSGLTSAQLQTNLNGAGTLQLAKPNLININIERSYCEIAALVEKTTMADEWPRGTQLDDINAKFQVNGKQIVIDSYSTALGNLSLHGNGVVDTQDMAFDILAVTRLSGDRTSENGCIVASTKLRDRDIPIRCKDAFATASANSCRPDGDIVKQLLQSAIVDEIRKKTGLNEQQSEVIKGLLKGLFGR